MRGEILTMKGIEINGSKLHEVGLYQNPYSPSVCVTLRYPKSRIRYSLEISKSYLEVPSLLAVELYRGGIIPQNPDKPLIIKESGRKVGVFLVKKVIYPSSCSDQLVRFELDRINE